MISSVSRRTHIPAFYFDWLANRLDKGWLPLRNPRNPASVGSIVLSPSTVECLVFQTENPKPVPENRIGSPLVLSSSSSR